MKRVVVILAVVIITANVFAQAPQKMSYQTVIRANTTNQLISAKAVRIKVSILQTSVDGAVVYSETHSTSTNLNGLASLVIGEGAIVGTATFASIDWAVGPYFIKVETDPSGGTNYSISSTSQLLSVPYALYSTNTASTPNTLITGVNNGDMNYWNGTAWTTVPVGLPGQTLSLSKDNIPVWCGSFTYQGLEYNTVTIGTQVWLVENLKVTKYNDGTDIPNVTVNSTWSALTTGAYCKSFNLTENSDVYGYLYNGYAVLSGKLAPKGWHIPSDAEWTLLETTLGGAAVTGGKLKEASTVHWALPNTGATNSTGFTALPGGTRAPNGTFSGLTTDGFWWSSSSLLGDYIWYRNMISSSGATLKEYYHKNSGLSVRCIKD